MPPVLYDLNTAEALPPTEGPKLRLFRPRPKKLLIKKLLSQQPNEISPGQGNAHVFEAQIDGKTYAVKIFKFFNLSEARVKIFDLLNDDIDDCTFTFHSDPFFAECRAYGKIQEIEARRKKQGIGSWKIAVSALGFIALSAATYGNVFREKFGIMDWNREDSDREKPAQEQVPFRAIVKEFVSPAVSVKDGLRMFNALKVLRRNGVFQRDIHERNYLDGLLVDFDHAWTEPHWVSLKMGEKEYLARRNMECSDWDNMTKREGIKTKMTGKDLLLKRPGEKATPRPVFRTRSKRLSRRPLRYGYDP